MTKSLSGYILAGAIIATASLATASMAAEFRTGFPGPDFDKGTWNLCQAVLTRLAFEKETDADIDRTLLRNTVDPSVGNDDDTCSKKALTATGSADREEVTDGSDLGPSFFAPPALTGKADDICNPAEKPIQRNELRFSGGSGLIHDVKDDHWYSMTFKLDGDIPELGSKRWVVGQWKEDNGSSPFLAQRFDNGVLHVTVQAGNCRCMIAQAPGDPDAKALMAKPSVSEPETITLKQSAPLKCIATDCPLPRECPPPGLKIWTANGNKPPFLPTPKEHWITMTYHVKAGGDGGGQVDVFANGKFVVRAEGTIGYPDLGRQNTKFKLGNYRDFIPGTARLEIDDLCLSKKSDNCVTAIDTVE